MFKYEWIWDKKRISNPMLAKKQPLKQHENILVFYEKQTVYNPQPYTKNTSGKIGKITHSKSEIWSNKETKTKEYSNKTGYPRSLITEIKVMNNLSNDKSGFHPTQKPIALMEYLIKTYTNESETVLDFTMGSGTTGVAACNLNRSFIGIELDPDYFKIATTRITAAEAQISF